MMKVTTVMIMVMFGDDGDDPDVADGDLADGDRDTYNLNNLIGSFGRHK